MATHKQAQTIWQIVEDAQKRQGSTHGFTLEPQIVDQLKQSRSAIYVIDPISYTFQTYPTLLAQQIMTNPLVLKSVQQFFKDSNSDTFTFKSPQDASSKQKPEFSYALTRYEIVSILETFCIQNDVTDKQQSTLQSFKDATSLDKMLEDFADQTYTISIDGKDVTFDCKDLISTLKLSIQELESLSPEESSSLDTRQRFYALTKFVEDKNLFKNYFPERPAESTFQDIKSSKYVDISAFNEHLQTNNAYLEQTKLSPELVDEVYRGMPDDLSKLEQAQFIYLKLCKILTYDQAYFACGQRGPLAQAHKSISYIPNITPENNNAVCYEFSAIYSKFLSDLNINHEIKFSNGINKVSDPYGHKHSHVSFRVGEYLVSADSMRTLARSDMARVKFGMTPQYLHLKNTNGTTIDKFINSLNKTTQLVNSLYEETSAQDASFISALSSYDKSTSPLNFISSCNKFSLILDLLNHCNEPPMEVMSYAYLLSDIILNGEEQEHFHISEVRHTPIVDDYLQTQVAELGLIFSIENSTLSPQAKEVPADKSTELPDDDFFPTPVAPKKNYTRAYYSSSTGVHYLSDEQMQKMFTSNEFSYIHLMDFPVPGGPISSMQYVINEEQ